MVIRSLTAFWKVLPCDQIVTERRSWLIYSFIISELKHPVCQLFLNMFRSKSKIQLRGIEHLDSWNILSREEAEIYSSWLSDRRFPYSSKWDYKLTLTFWHAISEGSIELVENYCLTLSRATPKSVFKWCRLYMPA